MKKVTNQDILLQEIMKDIQKIPDFIDGKKHKPVWREMQCIYYAIIKFFAPRFLTERQIGEIEDEIFNHTVNIQLISEDEALCSLINVFFNKKLMDYQERAIELELYEAVGNISKFYGEQEL